MTEWTQDKIAIKFDEIDAEGQPITPTLIDGAKDRLESETGSHGYLIASPRMHHALCVQGYISRQYQENEPDAFYWQWFLRPEFPNDTVYVMKGRAMVEIININNTRTK